MGKTALALNMVRNGWEFDGYDLIFSLETAKNNLGLRLLSQQTKISRK